MFQAAQDSLHQKAGAGIDGQIPDAGGKAIHTRHGDLAAGRVGQQVKQH